MADSEKHRLAEDAVEQRICFQVVLSDKRDPRRSDQPFDEIIRRMKFAEHKDTLGKLYEKDEAVKSDTPQQS